MRENDCASGPGFGNVSALQDASQSISMSCTELPAGLSSGPENDWNQLVNSLPCSFGRGSRMRSLNVGVRDEFLDQ